jgi:UDP-3-O-[3-hydroxymyristoyl] glucosamine N-acyltransferase
MTKGYTLQALADFLGCDLQGDPHCTISRLNTLQTAVEGEIAFLASAAYARYLPGTAASAVILRRQDAETFNGNCLITANPYLAYARLSVLFDRSYEVHPNIHTTAVIAPSAILGSGVNIGANAVIGEGAVIGDHAFIGSGTVLGQDVVIGDGCYLHANVCLYHGVSLGRHVIVHSGAVIGADGFGFANDHGAWVKIRQLGSVEIGDNVEIGANTTIDRGALGNTKIGHGVIIDNLVQIAHNVEVGDNSALAGCVGIAGSSKIGKNCVLAGGVGVVGHIELCAGVTITACTMVTKSITEPGVYSSGTPFTESARWRKNAVRFNQLDEMAKRLSSLEKKNRESE